MGDKHNSTAHSERSASPVRRHNDGLWSKPRLVATPEISRSVGSLEFDAGCAVHDRPIRSVVIVARFWTGHMQLEVVLVGQNDG